MNPRQARRASDDLLRNVTDETGQPAQSRSVRHDTAGHAAWMVSLHRAGAAEPSGAEAVGGYRTDWPGRCNPSVDDPLDVAHRIVEYHELGIETFILSGHPHQEEAYRVAELLFPEGL